MTPTTRSRTREATVNEALGAPGAGLEDVVRSVRRIARSSRELATDAGEVLERELAMAVSISERLRDESVSGDLLKQARSGRLNSGLRSSSHRIVDLLADALGVATVSAVHFGERMADEQRGPLSFEETAGGVPGAVASGVPGKAAGPAGPGASAGA